VRVRPGDRIGVYHINSGGALAYRLSGHPNEKAETHPGSGTINQGDEITFDSLPFPYVFAIAAYVANGMAQYSVLSQ